MNFKMPSWYYRGMKYFFWQMIATFCLLAPQGVLAAGLVPCGGEGETECNSCQIIRLGDRVFDWLIGVLTAIFILIIVVNGIRLLSSNGNVSAMKQSRSMITNAIIGFIIVLGAWTLVDLLLKFLLAGGADAWQPWEVIGCMPDALTN